jgi:hypothetical protein
MLGLLVLGEVLGELSGEVGDDDVMAGVEVSLVVLPSEHDVNRSWVPAAAIINPSLDTILGAPGRAGPVDPAPADNSHEGGEGGRRPEGHEDGADRSSGCGKNHDLTRDIAHR